jgi:cell division transport system permease protein
VVEILSLCGASDIFIAERFQWRFARLAAWAGALGGGLAALLVVVIKATGGSQSFTLALPFLYYDLLFILPCPLIVAMIAGVTARYVTVRLLGDGD